MQKEAIRQLNTEVAELAKQDEHFKQKEAELAKKERVNTAGIGRERDMGRRDRGREKKEGIDTGREGGRERGREGGREGGREQSVRH